MDAAPIAALGDFGLRPSTFLLLLLTAILTAPSAAQGAASTRFVDPRDGWVDLATRPYAPGRVGGHLKIARGPFGSISALRRESADVERLHKWLLGAPLLMEDPDVGPEGIVARPWGAAAPPTVSADGRRAEFRLRSDLFWEDGRPVSAFDYEATFRQMRKPETESSARDAFESVESVTADGRERLIVVWGRAKAGAATAFGLGFPVIPAHAVPPDPAGLNAMKRHLSCGPYRVVAHEGGTLGLELRSDPAGRPFPPRAHYVERITFEAPGDPVRDLLRVKSGALGVASLTADQYTKALRDPEFLPEVRVAAYALPAWVFIAWNLRDPADPKRERPHPVLGDLVVRRALAKLVDVRGIVAGPLAGLARPMTGPYPPGSDGADPSVAPPAFDPAAARAELAAAGWKPGPDGVLTKNGIRLSLTVLRPAASNPQFTVPCELLAETAAPLGIRIDVVPTPPGGIIDAGRRGRFDGALLVWTADAIEPDVRGQWHSAFARVESDNWNGYSDPETDRLLDALDVEPDAAVRTALRRRLHRRIAESAPTLFLWSPMTTVAVHRSWANVRVHDLGLRWWDFVDRDLFRKFPP